MSRCHRCDGSFPCTCNPSPTERQRFIRAAAIARAVSADQAKLPKTEDDARSTAALAWAFAEGLWACKPDGC